MKSLYDSLMASPVKLVYFISETGLSEADLMSLEPASSQEIAQIAKQGATSMYDGIPACNRKTMRIVEWTNIKIFTQHETVCKVKSLTVKSCRFLTVYRSINTICVCPGMNSSQVPSMRAAKRPKALGSPATLQQRLGSWVKKKNISL